jgi:hypothetical protein
MSAPPLEEPDSEIAGSEVDAILAEFGGDARAAIAALMHDTRVLLADAEQATSRGFLRGKFSEGLVVDDEP